MAVQKDVRLARGASGLGLRPHPFHCCGQALRKAASLLLRSKSEKSQALQTWLFPFQFTPFPRDRSELFQKQNVYIG